MTNTFFLKLRNRQVAESAKLQNEINSQTVTFDASPELSDYFFDTRKGVFKKFDDSGCATDDLSEMEVARLKKYAKTTGMVLQRA